MRLEIEVTQEDIDTGDPTENGSCPIALAVKRLTGRNTKVEYSYMEIEGLGESGLPQIAVRFIHAFDKHGSSKVQPFAFAVNVVPVHPDHDGFDF
jgi:hypothetical protein